ncbi:MAG: Uma2 family endonuclease [Planctomycetaceae bacterium]|nr:Uma2 family endonuclease [Planctomycetaceae bacterium]
MAVAIRLMTADEYVRMPDPGGPTELVRGEVVAMNQPTPRHGQICSRLIRIVGAFTDDHRLGHVLSNDAGILTQRDPDTVRGGDVWFVSYEKYPPGRLPDGYLELPPDIVFEVLSPTDRRGRLLAKIGEYLEAGVAVVCVLDPEMETAHLYFPEQPDVTLSAGEELSFPEQLPGFEVPVASLFE